MDLKVRKVGGSLGVILPKQLLDRLKVSEGETLSVTETPDGFQISPYNPKFARAMEGFERVRSRYRDALKELAK